MTMAADQRHGDSDEPLSRSILVYCAKSMAEGRAEMIKILRHQLELELRDRAFLLQLTEKVRRGEWGLVHLPHVQLE